MDSVNRDRRHICGHNSELADRWLKESRYDFCGDYASVYSVPIWN